MESNNKNRQPYEFWAEVGMIFCNVQDGSLQPDAAFSLLRELVESNSGMKCCRCILEQNLDDWDMASLLLVASKYLIYGNEEVSEMVCVGYVGRDVAELLNVEFKKNCSELLKKDLIKASLDVCYFFSLTENARNLLFDGEPIWGLFDENGLNDAENAIEPIGDVPAQPDIDVATFWRNVSELFMARRRREMRYGDMERELMRMVLGCQHIESCKRLMELNLNCFDFVFLVLLCSEVVDYERNEHPLKNFLDTIPFYCINLIVSQFKDKTSELLRQKLVTMSDSCDEVSLTEYGKNLLIDPDLFDDDEDDDYDVEEWLENYLNENNLND